MRGSGVRFWLAWSWRDLRRRWALTLAIGLLLAGGTGLAAGLGSMREWRVASNDRSFAALETHDLRVEVEEGAYVPEGSLARAATGISDASEIEASSERLIAPTQIDATASAPEPVLTPGLVIGVEALAGREVDGLEVAGGAVDAIGVEQGRGFAPRGVDGADPPEAILDPLYAEENGIRLPARIALPGDTELEVVGFGRSPETFVVTGPGGAFSAAADFGVVFTTLPVAQRVLGRQGQVNDLALRLAPGADAGAIAGQLEEAIAEQLGGIGISVSSVEDIDARRILYDDAENDQQLFNVFAFLILAGAAFGAFNLISRTVEAQRREIGIGMALGVPPSRLAIRPLMLGAQIALVGVVLGLGVGFAVDAWLSNLLADQLPLPILVTDFQASTFLRSAAIGLLIPMFAAAWPVWRGLRVTPIEAIRVGFRAARGSGLAPLLGRIPLPGNSVAQMPPRNVLRAPRRTLLTVLATAAVVSVAVSMSGLIDSFSATVDRNQAEELRGSPDRLSVTLDRFYGPGEGPVATIQESPLVARSDRRLGVAGEMRGPDEEIEVLIETLPDGAVWSPQPTEGRLPAAADEVLIAESAADDLGVEVGEAVELSHPRRLGRDRFTTEVSSFTVSGLHPDPFRLGAYVSPDAAARFGLEGAVNRLELLPTAGIDPAGLKRDLFGVPGAASIESASALGEALDEGLDEFAAVIRVVTGIAIALVLLIAFNSTAINADERARENATMFAYGLPLRAVLLLAVAESLIMGVLATLVGIGIGIGILNWVVSVSLEEVLPELGMEVALSTSSLIVAGLAGAGAMALAPLLTTRRLRRMDVPSTLRVIE